MRAAPLRFTYHRALTPLLGTLLAIGVIEMIVVHIVAMAYWGWKVAVALGLLDGSVVVALAALLRSFGRCPIEIAGDRLTMRTGHRMMLSVPLGDVAGFRAAWTADELKAPEVLNMALIAWPTIVFDLARPVARRRKLVRTVAHCVDDPVAFRTAVTAAIAGHVGGLRD